MNLLRLWLAFFLLAVPGDDTQDGGDAGGGDAGAGDGGDGGQGDGGEGDGQGDGADAGDAAADGADAGDGGQQRQAGRYDDDEVERRVQERLRQQQQQNQQRQVPQHVADEQRIFEAEEAKLRDPKITPLEKWQIESNRTLRQNTRSSTEALARAQDTEDRTSFRLACQSNKQLASVADDVENAVRKLKAEGQQPVAREALARFILGDKMLKAAGKPAQKPKAATPTPGREAPARPRSDVGKGSKQTGKNAALRQRLEGRII